MPLARRRAAPGQRRPARPSQTGARATSRPYPSDPGGGVLAREILTPNAPEPVGPYAQAVASGGFLFVSGQIPLDPATRAIVPGSIEEQTERVLVNLRAILEAAGSSLEAVVRTTVYLSDLSHFPRMNAVYARHFSAKPPPARSTIQAAALPLGADVEIDAIAALAGPSRAQLREPLGA